VAVLKFDVEEYCETNLSRVKVTSSNQVTAVCPWCEKHGGFYVDIATGNYICFKCEERGLRFVGVVAQVSGLTRQEAKRFIFKGAVSFRRKETPKSLLARLRAMRGKEEVEIEDVDFPLPDEFIPVYKNGKWRMPVYLKKRGVKKKTAREWGLGYCNKGRYAGRIIIPSECPNGRSFEARAIDGEQVPKTLGPKGADKSRLLFGWNQAKEVGDLVIVEGPFDALKVWQCGYSVVALHGKNLSLAQFVLLCKRHADSSVIIMLDPEEVEAPFSVAAQLLCYFASVYIARLPLGTDPGSASRRQIEKAYNDAKRFSGDRSMSLTAKVSASRRKISQLYQ